ncbi:MAG: 3-deoxy-7-phosphoheptulonate synthase, partial [Clostridia bacterium]|nr:3-deoxy-7-phosphoheptulonate synthase [Clostridia bacterium]
MIILLKQNANPKQVDNLKNWLTDSGYSLHESQGSHHSIIGLIGDTSRLDIDLISSLDVVEAVRRIQEPYKSANRKFHEDDTVIYVGDAKIGGGHFMMIAGPCSVETEEQITCVAKAVKKSGANMLRGGAFKPRTSPYAFQGLHGKGIDLLLEAKKQSGLPIITEIMDINHLPLFENVDVIQV